MTRSALKLGLCVTFDSLVVRSNQTDSGGAPGTVTNCNPSPGSSVDKRSPVTLTYVSALATVPNVVGQSQRAAASQLGRQGFGMSVQFQQVSSNGGVVLSQAPGGVLRRNAAARSRSWCRRWSPPLPRHRPRLRRARRRLPCPGSGNRDVRLVTTFQPLGPGSPSLSAQAVQTAGTTISRSRCPPSPSEPCGLSRRSEMSGSPHRGAARNLRGPLRTSPLQRPPRHSTSPHTGQRPRQAVAANVRRHEEELRKRGSPNGVGRAEPVAVAEPGVSAQ